MGSFFGTPLAVVNVGLRAFTESLEAQHVPVVDLDWRPPLVPKLQFTRSGVDMGFLGSTSEKRVP